jgi:serine/threonine protein kinase
MSIRFAPFLAFLALIFSAHASDHKAACETLLTRDLTIAEPNSAVASNLSSSGQRLFERASERLFSRFLGAKIKPIGEGGLGIVIEIVPKEGAPLVAKLIKDPQRYPEGHLEEQHELLERIRRGQGASSRLVRLMESREPDLILMERVEGVDLSSYLKNNGSAPDAATALFLMKEATLALSELHSMGLVHNDIKPANFMVVLAADGRPSGLRLIDFDLVRPDETVLESGLMHGTPGYMDFPQSLAGAIRKSKDLYSLMMLFRVLLLKAPGAIPQYTSADPQLEDAPGIWPVRGRPNVDRALWDVSPHSSRPEVSPVLSTIAFFRFESTEALLEALGHAEKALASGSSREFYEWFTTHHLERLPPSSKRNLLRRSRELTEQP